jgi:hypothetical protein
MKTFTEIEKDIELIKQRNERVEADKAWETSWSRKLVICVCTYFTVVLFFVFANLSNPFVNAIVPSLGFVLSTLSLPWFKRIWVRYGKG